MTETGPERGQSNMAIPPKQSYVPMFVIATGLTVVMAAVVLLQIVLQRDVYPVNKVFLGLDYNDVYLASKCIREGHSPYEIERYVTPPIPALVNVPATFLSFHDIKYVIILAALLSVVLSFVLIASVLIPTAFCDALPNFLALVSIVAFSYPVAFLFDRGNIDGFVLLLICLGLFCLKRHEWLTGILFALAISMKVYPVLLLIPILAARRWRLFLLTGGALLVLLLLAPGYWYTFVAERMLTRTSAFRIDENASLACTFHYIWNDGTVFNSILDWHTKLPVDPLLIRLSGIAYLTMLLAAFLLDSRDESMRFHEVFCAKTTLYLPFMVAVPRLVYHYELVCLLTLIPTLCWYWNNSDSPIQRTVLTLTSFGVAASQFQSVAIQKLAGSVGWHFVPGLGLLVVLIGTLTIRILWRSTSMISNKPLGDSV